MKLSITLILLLTLTFSCKKKEACIDTVWFERNEIGTDIHQEWAGVVKIEADSVFVSMIINKKIEFADTMIKETKIFPLNKWDTYKVSIQKLDTAESYDLSIQQRYRDCSNQD